MAHKRGTGRDRIIEAAWDLWTTKGPEGTTISEICQRAEVAQATFFYHFDTVPEVIAERVKVASQVDRFQHRLVVEDLSTVEAVEAFADLTLGEVMAVGAPIVAELVATMIARPQVFERFNDEHLIVRATFVLIYERARARGELAPDVDPGRLASAALSIAVFVLVEWAHGRIADDAVRPEVLARIDLLHRASLVSPPS